MKWAIDSPRGRKLYSQLMATMEPVFVNIRHNKQLNRFTLRMQPKVDTQWTLYCLVTTLRSWRIMVMRSGNRRDCLVGAAE